MRRSDLPLNSFPARRLVRRLEGGAVHAAEHNGKHYVIEDESALLDLLSAEDREGCVPVRVYEFDNEQDLNRYLQDRGWMA